MTRLLDTHCHLDAYPEPLQVLAEADSAGVDVVAVTETPDAYRRLRTRVGPRRPGIQIGIGFHPASRPAAAPGQLERFFRLAHSADWVGEVGLDFHPGIDRREKTRQIHVLESILSHASVAAKPITVHSRGAAADTIRLVEASSARRVVLHWYTGPAALLDDALEAQCRFSINPAMLGSPKARALVGRIPPDRVLTETDGPYCQRAGRPARPADVAYLTDTLAGLWSVSPEEARARLGQTARDL